MNLLLNSLILFASAFVISFIASQGGISGAFLMVPIQIYVLGTGMPVVSSTNYLYNIIGIPLAIYRYIREGRLLRPLFLSLAIPTCIGAVLGSYIRVVRLYSYESFRYIVAFVLLALSINLLITLPRFRGNVNVKLLESSWYRISLRYDDSGTTCSFSPVKTLWVPFLVGIVSGMYGIGGAAFLSPILMGVYGLPAYITTGSTLASDLVVSMVTAGTYTVLGVAPNLLIGIPMGIGGLMGMYLGTRVQRRIPERIVRLIVSLVSLITGVLQVVL
ncbi:sulfite exporter TauE/SafE family protein [Vulcanisaeta thermophila]|uniref:sulfite exporter TauE/SafE family protein n=1 Tax=Vulcanisaeta thermophila TaxID=867917 RepID=UPI000852B5A0|nr:sulfite exporter TauE/SafE family protein [Vulcanisaeta thermophila]